MPDKISALHKEMNALMEKINEMSWIKEKKYPTAALMYYMECVQMHLYYGETSQAKNCVTAVQNIVGLGIDLSVAYAKNTRFRSNWELLVKLGRNNNNQMSAVPLKVVNQFEYPLDVRLQNDTLQNKVPFVADEDYHVNCLLPEEQLVLLVYCLLRKKIFKLDFDEFLLEGDNGICKLYSRTA
ncbi:tetratricopeptide repeat protein 27 [Trichonephila clavipes]|nr:tetratricopeptide repeat protein 27 [Trichonephila clavipes]